MAAPQPPNNSFFGRAYNDSWKLNWKAYIGKTTISIADRYKTIQKYEAMLPKGKVYGTDKKKKIQLDNQKQVLFAEALQNKLAILKAKLVAAEQAAQAAMVSSQQNPANSKLQNAVADAQADAAAANAALVAALPNSDLKAGCVIVFSDGKALYTKSQNRQSIQYGFPKGNIEYKLQDENDIETVYRETPMAAALRELYEETGFHLDSSKLPIATNVVQGVATTLYRLQYPEFYRIRGIQSFRDTRTDASGNPLGNYYLILYLVESSVAQGPSLLPLSPHPQMDEQIVAYEIRNQYTKNTARDFNFFSQIAFPVPQVIPPPPMPGVPPPMPGGRRKKLKSRKTKRKGRKTMRSRSRG